MIIAYCTDHPTYMAHEPPVADCANCRALYKTKVLGGIELRKTRIGRWRTW